MVMSSGKSFLFSSAKVDLPEPVPPAIPINIGVAIMIPPIFYILSIAYFLFLVNNSRIGLKSYF